MSLREPGLGLVCRGLGEWGQAPGSYRDFPAIILGWREQEGIEKSPSICRSLDLSDMRVLGSVSEDHGLSGTHFPH